MFFLINKKRVYEQVIHNKYLSKTVITDKQLLVIYH